MNALQEGYKITIGSFPSGAFITLWAIVTLSCIKMPGE